MRRLPFQLRYVASGVIVRFPLRIGWLNLSENSARWEIVSRLDNSCRVTVMRLSVRKGGSEESVEY